MAAIYKKYMRAGDHPYAVLRNGVKVADCDRWEDYSAEKKLPWLQTQEKIQPGMTGQDVFTIYAAEASGTNHAGGSIPEWQNLSPEQQAKWNATVSQ